MSARILNGNEIRDQIRKEVAADMVELRGIGIRPGLAVILAGNNPASELYTRNKVKSCESLGIHSERLVLPETVSTEELLDRVAELNSRDEIDGILVQLPLPSQVDSKKVLLAVDPQKDVDGFHPMNIGNLVTQRPGLIPCTPAGILEILKRSNITIAGQRAVVVGRSDIVGKPVSLLLMHRNATVTVCHSRTKDLPAVCREGDILIACLGKTAMITGEYVKPGATVIDVGINQLKTRDEVERYFPGDAKRMQEFETKGSTLIGDVDPVTVRPIAGAITPVPGGVGPLTIAMLMANTVRAARLRHVQTQTPVEM
ncbi:MAG: bifunctional 5,10-methylenetetrahydrofolate dehydrogenase/5,10-methenyltetrahydrofolate cyclohydrolase [Acidobacteria bacterium]|nr:bifunctional 5,10-methylenetetrahydrofolate dehydrogenase/5,10-methenyltetrahydrofolate cyclohydrolase [Acidobacteriota bacterium]